MLFNPAIYASGGGGGSVILPEQFKGFYTSDCVDMSALAIGTNAYASCSGIRNVYFPECLYVDWWAFQSCYNIKSINLPKCKWIGQSAFEILYGLEYLNIPECEVIGIDAFASVSFVNNFVLNLSKCTTISRYAFTRSANARSQGIVEVSLPMCSYIGSAAFVRQCISKIFLPRISYLEAYVFRSQNSSIAYIDMPSCGIIYQSAFESCSFLSDAYISLPSVTYIVDSAFLNCGGLTSISLPKCTQLGQSVFAGCRSLREVYLSAGIFSIGDGTFMSTAFTNIDFWPSRCGYLKNKMFYNCYSLSIVSSPYVLSIGMDAFRSCYSLREVNLPNCSVIGTDAFCHCSELVNVNIPSCRAIMGEAFWGCLALSVLSLYSVSNISRAAFSRCTSLKSLYLYVSSVPSLSSGVFDYSPLSAGGTGNIYVPSSLYNTFITASYWSLVSARITSM